MGNVRSEDFYNKESEIYDDLRLSGDGNSVNDFLQKRLVHDFVSKIDREGDVLEIAPGTGRLTEVLTEYLANITAVDISSEMLKKLADKSFSSQVKLVHSDILSLESDETFDLIFFINAASHMEDFEGVCEWCARHLAPGGQIYFNVPNLYSIYFMPGLLVRWKNRSILRNVFTRWYTAKEIATLAKELGLKSNVEGGITHAPLGTPKFLTRLFLWFNDNFDGFNKYFGSQLFMKLELPVK